MNKILIKKVRAIDPSTNFDLITDVLIENGKIVSRDKVLPELEDCIVVQGEGLWLTPGLIDIHVHFRDPGNPEKETMLTGAQAALKGGFTSVCCMPNTKPAIDNISTLTYALNEAKKTSIKIYPVAAATVGLGGSKLTDMKTLKDMGAVAFSDDGHCILNSQIMRQVLEYLATIDAPFICHAEDLSLSNNGCMNEGYYSTLYGLPGIPNTSESIIVARDIELARLTGTKIHFAHVSTAESINLIRKAKEEGLNITAETAPHYLILRDKDIPPYNSNFKMNPPLRGDKDRQALIEGIYDGTIDAIATDHAPHTLDEKNLTFNEAPNGIIGLETSLSLILHAFYHNTMLMSKPLAPLDIIRLMSYNPAKCLNIPGGTLQIGDEINATLIDPLKEWTVDPNQFASKSRNTPFSGITLKGKAVKVIYPNQILDL